MSLLQNQDYVIHRIRTRYLQSVRDGVGERLITLNPTVFNVAGYKNAGWPNAADQGKTYSPPIPAGASGDYFMALPRSAALERPVIFDGEEDEDTKAAVAEDVSGSLGLAAGFPKAGGRGGGLMQGQDEDSSDLSDESDLEEDLSRAAQQIKFNKMPIRQRAGSSPIISSNLSTVRQRAGSSPTMSSNPKLMITSPGKSTKMRVRSGSHGMMEYEKSKEFNAQSNDFRLLSHRIDEDTEAFKDISHKLRASPATSFRDEHSSIEELDFDSDEDMEDDGSTMSSDFTETEDSQTGLLSGSSLQMVPAPLFASAQHNTNGTSPSLDPLPPPRPISQMFPVSALTQLIKGNQESHPLDVYTVFSGKGDVTANAPRPMMSRRGGGPVDENSPLKIKIYRPSSADPTTPFEIIIKRVVLIDGIKRPVSVADTIGFALYRYREEDLEPELSEEEFNINKWVLCIIDEDTMEPDIDFPPIDRKAAISTFNLNELALVEASPAEYDANEKATPNMIVKKEKSQTVSSGSPAQQTAVPAIRPADAPAPANQSSARTGAPQNIKIHINTPDVYDQSATVRVTTDTYIAEVLDMICKKKHLVNESHMLRIPGTNTVVPIDRTVESLQGRVELELIPRKHLDGLGDRPGSPSTVNPNTPLRITGLAKGSGQKKSMLSQSVTAADMLLGAGYQKFTVWRKMPMSFISRHERVLAIDGEYVHIMPSDQNKTLFESPKTTSIHISALIGCKQSRKAPNNFKLIVMKSREWKRLVHDPPRRPGGGADYDKLTKAARYAFEASNAVQAAEIVRELKKQMAAYKMDQTG